MSKPRSSSTLLLDIYQRLGTVEGQLTAVNDAQKALLRAHETAAVDRTNMGATLAVVHQEVRRLSPIVGSLQTRADSGEGAKGVGRLWINFMSGGIGGLIAALMNYFSTRPH